MFKTALKVEEAFFSASGKSWSSSPSSCAPNVEVQTLAVGAVLQFLYFTMNAKSASTYYIIYSYIITLLITKIHTSIFTKYYIIITLHCIALHCIALHCTTLHYTTLHYITLHYIIILLYHFFDFVQVEPGQAGWQKFPRGGRLYGQGIAYQNETTLPKPLFALTSLTSPSLDNPFGATSLSGGIFLLTSFLVSSFS